MRLEELKVRSVARAAFAGVIALAFGLSGRAVAEIGPSPYARRASNAISALDFDEARTLLARADPDDVEAAAEGGRLALYEGRCDDALIALGRADILKTDGGAALFDIARGCARVTAATVVDTDEAHAVVIRYQDEADRALTPLIVATVSLAREALTRDLGVSWPKPTRITVVRDLMSLSAMTGLPQKSAQTTGTVAVAKWGRVTLLSPRASQHGFPWRDTLAHELTHLAVTRATADRAPLWLQEGVAKREEIRWRPPGPFDDRPSPDAIVARGAELKLTIPLDQLGPSIAMLPSADAAMVAFAEVTSFVRYFASSSSPDALPKLLLALRGGRDPDAALKESSGADLRAWDARWRASLLASPPPPLPAAFGLGAEPEGTHNLRDRVRLAELLYGRAHAAAALTELGALKADSGAADPSVRSLRAHVFDMLGKKTDGELQVQDPNAVSATFGPWWAIRGRWERQDADQVAADSSFVEAVATDPFDVESSCETDELQPVVPDDSADETAAQTLCAAARARHEPALGRD